MFFVRVSDSFTSQGEIQSMQNCAQSTVVMHLPTNASEMALWLLVGARTYGGRHSMLPEVVREVPLLGRTMKFWASIDLLQRTVECLDRQHDYDDANINGPWMPLPPAAGTDRPQNNPHGAIRSIGQAGCSEQARSKV